MNFFHVESRGRSRAFPLVLRIFFYIQKGNMAILKKKNNDNFTKVPNDLITCDLSDKAFRLAIYLLSKPDDWNIYQNKIAKDLNCSRKTINVNFKELKDKGFLEIEKIRVRNGFDYFYHLDCYKNVTSQKCNVTKMCRHKNVTHTNTNYNKDLLNNNNNNDDVPTPKQIELAESLGIELQGQSKIILSKEIEKALNAKKINGNYIEPEFEEPEASEAISNTEMEELLK